MRRLVEHKRAGARSLRSDGGAHSIPDPTSAGDFCRRFREEDVNILHDAINEAIQAVWARQPAMFTDGVALIEADGCLNTEDDSPGPTVCENAGRLHFSRAAQPWASGRGG